MAVWINLGVASIAGLLLVGGCNRTDTPGSIASNEAAVNVVGNSLEADPIIPANRIESMKQEAAGGNNEAAGVLAGHYRSLGRTDEERRWLLLAANRSDCASMSWLRENADEAGDRAGATHWNDMLRRHDCTWARTYRLGATENSAADNAPLWNEQ